MPRAQNCAQLSSGTPSSRYPSLLHLGRCPEIVSPSLRIHLGLGVAMELALGVIGQMASRSQLWKAAVVRRLMLRRGAGPRSAAYSTVTCAVIEWLPPLALAGMISL